MVASRGLRSISRPTQLTSNSLWVWQHQNHQIETIVDTYCSTGLQLLHVSLLPFAQLLDHCHHPPFPGVALPLSHDFVQRCWLPGSTAPASWSSDLVLRPIVEVPRAFGSTGTPASRRIHDGKSKACGHRAGAGVLGNAPGWTSPHPPLALETCHFGGHICSALAWPWMARTKAHASQGIMCWPNPDTATPLLGRPPARSLLHHPTIFAFFEKDQRSSRDCLLKG